MEKLNLKEIKSRLSKGRNLIPEYIPDDIVLLIGKMARQSENDDITVVFDQIDNGSSPLDEENLLMKFNKRITYDISLRKATWTTIGLILDIYLTSGVVSAILSNLGYTSEILIKIRNDNGEICVLKVLRGFEKPIRSTIITNKLKGKKCPYLEFDCIHREGNDCNIKNDNVIHNLNKLYSIGLTKNDLNKWTAIK